MAEQIEILPVEDPKFAPYGRIIDCDCPALIAAAKQLPLPKQGAAYEASIESLEACPEHAFFRDEIYGEMPIQIGNCRGHNNQLNALEWHRDSEINVAVTDFVLILAKLEQFVAGKLDSACCKAFRVKAGQTVEVYATSLHFCPCTTDKEGFNCIVILPKGTNVLLEKTPSDKLLFRKNKWIIAHQDNKALIDRGVVPGIVGVNYTIE